MSRKSPFGNIIQIGDILVSEDVVMEYFSCDYNKCQGECCVAGDSGAPLDEEELEGLERDFPAYEPYLSELSRQTISSKGFFEVDRDGDLVTPVCPGRQECAYSHFTQDGSCLCSIELSGRRKPSSCCLYPIRITRLTGGGLALNVHHWDICKPAFEKGKAEGVKVYKFLKRPLTEQFGQEFYDALVAAEKHMER